MRKILRVALGLVSAAVGGAVVLAAVREHRARTEFERCVARWPSEPSSPIDEVLSRELTALDDEVTASSADAGTFAPCRWTPSNRKVLERDLAGIEPAVARMVALVDSAPAREQIAHDRNLGSNHHLMGAREWANRLAAHAVCAASDADAARWLDLSFRLNELRTYPSTIGISIRTALDVITLAALRERVCRTGAQSAPYMTLLDERLVERQSAGPWRAAGAAEARELVRNAAPLLVKTGGTPLRWWQHATELQLFCAVLHYDEVLAAGGSPRSAESPFGLQTVAFDSIRQNHEWSCRVATLARVALRVATLRDAHAGLPRTAGEARIQFADAGDVAQLEYALAPTAAELSLPGPRGSAVIESWTIPLD